MNTYILEVYHERAERLGGGRWFVSKVWSDGFKVERGVMFAQQLDEENAEALTDAIGWLTRVQVDGSQYNEIMFEEYEDVVLV